MPGCYSKKVTGSSVAKHMRAELVVDALKNATATTLVESSAIWRSGGARLHLDTSTEFRARVAGLGMPSMGRTGVCWDNSVAGIVLITPEKSACLSDCLRD